MVVSNKLSKRENMKLFKIILRISITYLFLLPFLLSIVGNALGWPAAWMLGVKHHNVTLTYEHGELHFVLHHHELDKKYHQIHEFEPIDSTTHHVQGYDLPLTHDHDNSHDHKIHASDPGHYFRVVKKYIQIFKNHFLFPVSFEEVNFFFKEVSNCQYLKQIKLRYGTPSLSTVVLRI
jgi:hypothetical protein